MTYAQSENADKNFSMRLSFAVGLFMLVLKSYAYFITGSAAILSDASESVIHVFAVGVAAYSMWLSLKPADQNHMYGHEKVSFFSAGVEGAMITAAAIFILYESIYKIIFGIEIQNLEEGFGFILVAVMINLVLGLYLIRKGKIYKSIILEANGKHILTDCWTSIGVLTALMAVKFTGILLFDPIIAILTACNILWTGWKLVKTSIGGLMDQTDAALQQQIVKLLNEQAEEKKLEFHHLRHRQAGDRLFIEFHLLFPTKISLEDAHEIATEIEAYLRSQLEGIVEISTHLEPKKGHNKIHKKYGLPI